MTPAFGSVLKGVDGKELKNSQQILQCFKSPEQRHRKDSKSGEVCYPRSGMSSGFCFSVLAAASFSKLLKYEGMQNGILWHFHVQEKVKHAAFVSKRWGQCPAPPFPKPLTQECLKCALRPTSIFVTLFANDSSIRDHGTGFRRWIKVELTVTLKATTATMYDREGESNIG